jgi:hypothetical protein
MSDWGGVTGAAVRVADVLLRTVGGGSVKLRMPAPAVPADVTEQLGIATPTFQDVPLSPVVYRKSRATAAIGKAARRELLVSASAIQALVGSLGYESANVLFGMAYGVLEDDQLLQIESATEELIAGRPYLYRLILLAPLSRIV